MKTLSFLLLLAALPGCVSVTDPFAGAKDPALLPGSSWRLVSVGSGDGGSSAARSRLTLSFTADGHVGGRAGPNHYGGDYEATASGEIRMRNVVGTLIGGPDAEQAAEYLRLVTRARGFEVGEDELRLRLPEGGSLRFAREADPER